MKKMFALFLALTLMLSVCMTASAAMSSEELKELFALSVDTEGKTAEELYALGQAYEAGEGVTQWFAMAKACYEAAEAAGSPEAAQALVDMEAYRQGVMDNSPDAQGEIFDFFRSGVVASQQGDREKAYNVSYDDAFFFGDPMMRGLDTLAQYAADNGDVEKALAIYEYNAEVLGKGNGYTAIGLMYAAEDGTYEGIAHSDETALNYFLMSFQNENNTENDFKGPRYAAVLLDSGYQLDDGTEVAPDYAVAEEYFLIAAAGNGRTFDGTACVYLGQYYEEGREGVEQDMEKAVTYYTMALSDSNVHGTMLGIPKAALVLGRCYENGTGVEADAQTAVQYYTLARDYAQENLDLVEAAGNDENMVLLQQEAVEALARLGAGE